MDSEDLAAHDDEEPPIRSYVYLLSEVRDGASGAARYEDVAQIDVDLDHYGSVALVAGMRPWGVEYLREHRCDAGLYYIELSAVDVEGDMGVNIDGAYIPWSGSRILTATG